MASNSTLLSRRQVAALLASSEAEVRARDNVTFHPTKAADGSWRYEPAEVSAVLRGVAGDDPGREPNGAACAAAFELFKTGTSLADTVISLKQPPAIVRGLRTEYDAMTACLTIDQSALEMLAKLLHARPRDGAHLVEMAAALAERTQNEYQTGYNDGLADATDCGEIVDPNTGQKRPLEQEDIAAGALRRNANRPTAGRK